MAQYETPLSRLDILRSRLYYATTYKIRYQWPDRFQAWVPRILPRWLVYRTTIMAFSRAWHEAGDKSPDELTFGEVVKPWEGRR